MLTSIVDANGNTTSYQYDDLTHALLSTTFPDGLVESNTYYDDGQFNYNYGRLNGKQNVYDHLKRVTQRLTASPTATYTYTGQKLVQVDDWRGSGPVETHTFTYDTAYRVSIEIQGGRGVLTRTYDAADRMATYMVQSGPTATYTYYPDGSLNTIVWTPVAGQFKYRYTLAGQYQQISFPNGQTRNYTYDDQGRLGQLTNLASGGTNIATYAYGYDLNTQTSAYDMLGQRVTQTATVPSQGLSNHQTKYQYDALYQLTKATYPNVAPFNGEVDSWTYDAIGNRLTNTVNGVTQTYTYAKNGANPNNGQRLLSDGVNTYTHNAQVTASRSGPSGAFSFFYDVFDHMTSISGALAASYAYDYQGRRVSKTVGGVTSTYFYSRLDLIQENGATPADYLLGPTIDEPLAMRQSGQLYYSILDGLGSVTGITNASAVIQSGYLYDSWGQTRSQTGTLPSLFTYTSREVAEAGTVYFRARYMSPSLGRFLSEDPIALGSDHNLYVYAAGSPMSFADPSGLEAQVCCRPLADKIAGPILKDKHCYIKTDITTYGLYPEGNFFVFRVGVPRRSDKRDVGGQCLDCKPKPVPCVTPETCFERTHQNYPIGGYGELGTNSNTYAGTMARTCCSNFTNTPPFWGLLGWDYHPPLPVVR